MSAGRTKAEGETRTAAKEPNQSPGYPSALGAERVFDF